MLPPQAPQRRAALRQAAFGSNRHEGHSYVSKTVVTVASALTSQHCVLAASG